MEGAQGECLSSGYHTFHDPASITTVNGYHSLNVLRSDAIGLGKILI